MDPVDIRLLGLANAIYRERGNRARDVREQFDMTETEFWRRVNTLLDDPTAVREHPELTLRLRRLREDAAAQRAPRGPRQ